MVFEIEADPTRWARPKARRERIIWSALTNLRHDDPGSDWSRRIEQVGATPATDLNGFRII